MKASYGEEIKRLVSMKQVADYYGFRVDSRTQTMLCPFHDDHHRSMHVYSGRRGFYCFSCGAGGSVIDFVMRMSGLSFQDACKKMDEDFHLGLNIDGKVMDEEKRKKAEEEHRKRVEELERRKNREKQLYTAYHSALDRYCMLDLMKMENEPRKGADGKYRITKAYVYAIKRIDAAWADVGEAAANLQQFERERDNE